MELDVSPTLFFVFRDRPEGKVASQRNFCTKNQYSIPGTCNVERMKLIPVLLSIISTKLNSSALFALKNVDVHFYLNFSFR